MEKFSGLDENSVIWDGEEKKQVSAHHRLHPSKDIRRVLSSLLVDGYLPSN